VGRPVPVGGPAKGRGLGAGAGLPRSGSSVPVERMGAGMVNGDPGSGVVRCPSAYGQGRGPGGGHEQECCAYHVAQVCDVSQAHAPNTKVEPVDHDAPVGALGDLGQAEPVEQV
jgi:hypothetical protein